MSWLYKYNGHGPLSNDSLMASGLVTCLAELEKDLHFRYLSCESTFWLKPQLRVAHIEVMRKCADRAQMKILKSGRIT
jgi:hypothetical protein